MPVNFTADGHLCLTSVRGACATQPRRLFFALPKDQRQDFLVEAVDAGEVLTNVPIGHPVRRDVVQGEGHIFLACSDVVPCYRRPAVPEGVRGHRL